MSWKGVPTDRINLKDVFIQKVAFLILIKTFV